MSSSYANFLNWMKSKQGNKAEIKYQISSRNDLQSKYLSDAISKGISQNSQINARSIPEEKIKKDELSEEYTEECKQKIEEEYKKILYEIWKDKEQLGLLVVFFKFNQTK